MSQKIISINLHPLKDWFHNTIYKLKNVNFFSSFQERKRKKRKKHQIKLTNLWYNHLKSVYGVNINPILADVKFSKYGLGKYNILNEYSLIVGKVYRSIFGNYRFEVNKRNLALTALNKRLLTISDKNLIEIFSQQSVDIIKPTRIHYNHIENKLTFFTTEGQKFSVGLHGFDELISTILDVCSETLN